MKNIHIRKQTGILLCMLFALALSACTSKNITEPAEPAKQTFGAAPIQKSEEAEAVMESQSEEIAEENRFCGQWILAGYEYGERENAGDTPIRTPYYLAGDEGEESKIHIYSEGDQLYADYYHCQNEGTTTINGMAFEEETTTTEDQPAARLKNRMDESEIRRTVTLLEDNVLQYREQYYGMTSDYTYNGIYMREGSKELEQRSEYQYLDVVTVSTVEELVEEIGGGLTQIGLLSAMLIGSSSACFSPASSVGGLIISSIAGDPILRDGFDNEKAFATMFLWSVAMVAVSSLLALAGIYNIFH